MPGNQKTLVLGLGNPILTDDGIGVLVVEAVKAKLPEQPPVDFAELSVGGLTLMEQMIGYNRVILIDAYQPPHNIKPGTIHRFTVDEMQSISPTQHSASPHDANLITALETGRRMGLHLPKEITIFAIEVENVIDFSDQPTASVAKAIPAATEAVLAELGF
jgi:hydrogenase maturation protease